MKKTHIILLVAIAVSIAILISFMGDLSTYETIASARQKEGKNVTIIAKLDNSKPIEYDPRVNPNYCSFHVMDTLGNKARVVYHYEKPYDMEKAEKIVMKGKMKGDIFECDNILLKCPSKYKDDKKQLEKTVSKSNS